MAQDDPGQDDSGGGTDTTKPCRSAKDVLQKVTDEINQFESKKLGELKASLETFVKNQDKLVEGYREKYPVLRKTWCDRQQDVERLYAHIKCEFPLDDEKWKALIQECICRKKHELYCLRRRIARRKRCCSGELQRTRDAAAEAFELAKAELDTLQNLAQRIADALAANLNVIGEIEKLPSAERAAALYLFWFKLLPNHKALTPTRDIPDACRKLGADNDPATLCKPTWEVPCKDETGGCAPPKEEEWKPPEPQGPFLMHPDDYLKALDCAWDKYDAAKTALAQAEADYKRNPDDLTSLEKLLVDGAKALDDEIKKCLKGHKPKDGCCKEPGTGTTATQTTNEA
jgi:hypothetical protein